MAGMVYLAERYMTLFMSILWVALYYILSVRKRILRITTSFILPVLFTVFLFIHFYYFGGIGAYSKKEVEAQKGVEIIWSKENFPKDEYFSWLQYYYIMSRHPREVFYDPKYNSIYINYASTYGEESEKENISVLKIDLTTKEVKHYESYYTRVMGMTDDTILIVPWFDKEIIELSKKDLSEIRRIPTQVDFWPQEFIDIYYDKKNEVIYLSNDMTPAFLKYDYKTGKLLAKYIPTKYEYGGTFWRINISSKTEYIYLIGFGTEGNIYEFEPENLKILRMLDLKLYGGSALTIDEEKNELYFQDGGSNKLYVIDIETFKIKRIMDGSVHAVKIYIDKIRNYCYLVSYFYGKLIVLDLSTGEKIKEIRLGGKPYGLYVYKNFLYTNSMLGVIRIDLNSI